MEKLSIHRVMMNCALEFAKRSTCARIHCGAVISVQNHIVSTGYNGTAHGREHCTEHFEKQYEIKKTMSAWALEYPTIMDYFSSDFFKNEHRTWSLINELHAESNAIIYAARRGIAIDGGTIYSTHSPCLMCAKSIIFSGIKTVYYLHLYDREEGFQSIDLMKSNNIEVIEIQE
jgi:dCMP deaminase